MEAEFEPRPFLVSVVWDLFLLPVLTLPQLAPCFVASGFISSESQTTGLFTTHLLVTCSRVGSQANSHNMGESGKCRVIWEQRTA